MFFRPDLRESSLYPAEEFLLQWNKIVLRTFQLKPQSTFLQYENTLSAVNKFATVHVLPFTEVPSWKTCKACRVRTRYSSFDHVEFVKLRFCSKCLTMLGDRRSNFLQMCGSNWEVTPSTDLQHRIILFSKRVRIKIYIYCTAHHSLRGSSPRHRMYSSKKSKRCSTQMVGGSLFHVPQVLPFKSVTSVQVVDWMKFLSFLRNRNFKSVSMHALKGNNTFCVALRKVSIFIGIPFSSEVWGVWQRREQIPFKRQTRRRWAHRSHYSGQAQ